MPLRIRLIRNSRPDETFLMQIGKIFAQPRRRYSQRAGMHQRRVGRRTVRRSHSCPITTIRTAYGQLSLIDANPDLLLRSNQLTSSSRTLANPFHGARIQSVLRTSQPQLKLPNPRPENVPMIHGSSIAPSTNLERHCLITNAPMFGLLM